MVVAGNLRLEAFALRPFQSTGSNARSVVHNRNTASSKMLRLLQNVQLAEHLGTVFDSLNLVKAASYLNVDHSDVDGLTALVGAIQTRNSRAIPAMLYPSQNKTSLLVRNVRSCHA